MHNLSRLLDTLNKLNDLEGAPPAAWTTSYSPEECRILIESLKTRLPTALLGHHERAISRGRRSLSPVHNGVCGACHLRLSIGHHRPGTATELDVCEHCGAFLEWPAAGQSTRPAIAVRTKRRLRQSASVTV